jgi:hypothetical protein
VSSANGDYQCRLDVQILRKTRPWPRNERPIGCCESGRKPAQLTGWR